MESEVIRQSALFLKAAQTNAEAATSTAIPSQNQETNIPVELTFREDSEQPKVQTADQKERPATAQQSALRPKAPAPQTRFGTEAETAAQTDAKAAIPAAIPSANEETGAPAELTYRAESEFQPAAQRETQAPAPQNAVHTEAANAAQAKAEIQTVIPTAHAETADLTPCLILFKKISTFLTAI